MYIHVIDTDAQSYRRRYIQAVLASTEEEEIYICLLEQVCHIILSFNLLPLNKELLDNS